LGALHVERQRFIDAVDHSLEAPLAEDLDAFLKKILPLFEDVNLKAQTVALADLLARVEASPDALAALTRLATREGYRPLEVTPGMIAPLVSYSRIDPVITELLRIVGEGGEARSQWKGFLGSLYHDLANLERADLMGPDHSLELVRELMLQSRPDFSDGVGRFVAQRDERGIAKLNGESPSDWEGSFSDVDFDGLPDVDAQGSYVDQAGTEVGVAAPFAVPREVNTERDTHARLLGSEGRLVYSYLDASQTLIAASMHEASVILQRDPEAFLNLIHPLEVVLGPSEMKSRTYESGETLSFSGFDTAGSPLIDIAHAAGSYVHTPEFYYLIRLTEQLFENREADIATLVRALLLIRDWSEQEPYESLTLAPNSVLVDEVIDLLVDISGTPGLLEDILDALDDPRAKALPGFFAQFLRYKDSVNYSISSDGDMNGPAVTEGLAGANTTFTYSSPVERNLADSSDNRSLFQRFSHLIYDTDGAPLCNREGAVMDLGWISYPLWGDGYAECELFEIPNMAAFYVDVVLGNGEMEFKDGVVEALANVDFMLESLSEVDGFTKRPTFKAVNRVMFGQRNAFLEGIFDSPRAPDGGALDIRHPATIFAWEEPGFIEALSPMLEAVSLHGRQDLIGKMLGLFHKHWGTSESDFIQTTDPSAPVYAYGTGVSKFEELIARGLEEADLMNAAGDLAGAALELQFGSYDGATWMARAIRQLVLPERNRELTARDGSTSLARGDGTTLVGELSPARLFVDASRNIEAAFDGRDEEKDALFSALDAVIDTVLAVRVEEGVPPSFEDRRAYASVTVMLEFLRDRIDAHSQAGDLVSWATSMPDKTEELLEEPLVQTGVGLVASIVNSAQTRSELEQAIAYLFNQESPNDAFTVTVAALADALQVSTDDVNLVPLLKAMAPALEPNDGVVVHLLQFMADANAMDDKQVSTRLIRGLVAERDGNSETAFEAFVEIAGAVNREVPGSQAHWSEEDYATFLQVVREFLVDEDHGLERLYQLLENR